MAVVDLSGEQREPPPARPRLLNQLLRLLRQTRPKEEVCGACTGPAAAFINPALKIAFTEMDYKVDLFAKQQPGRDRGQVDISRNLGPAL